jgi:signal transduction histidine kinase
MLKETKEMSADMRSLSHQLHSSRLELVGLVPALSGVCQETTKNYGIEVRFTESEFIPDLTKDVSLCLFRVAQEALTNVVKHSQATSAHVELRGDAKAVGLQISDTGHGFDTNLKNEGIGLLGMRERLRLVGGRLSVTSEPMRGTVLFAEIPLSASGKQTSKRAAGEKQS